jgi:hypothetical protein
MSEKTITITESEGTYRVQNDGLSEFELIGILECLVFEMKSARRHALPDKKTDAAAAAVFTPASQEVTGQPEKAPQETSKETIQSSASLELRTRINNAVKAIKNLGGEVGDVNRSDATDEELQTELEELTNQYKRLKNSKGTGK